MTGPLAPFANTLLTALYVFIDDHVVIERSGRGRRPELSDAELVCLAVARVLLGYRCERRWVRHIHTDPRRRAMFPYLPQHSGYHKRLEAAQHLLCWTILPLATASPSWFDDVWMTDATPVPCGASRAAAKRSDLAGHANYGYCASHSRFYPGLKPRRRAGCDHCHQGNPCAATPRAGKLEIEFNF